MVQDIKPRMRKIAEQIIEDHLSSSVDPEARVPLSSLIAKAATKENFNDNKIKNMVGLTNEAYVLKTGSHNVPIAGYDEVVSYLDKYNKPKTKVANYNYPEYKSSSSFWEGVDLSNSLRKSANLSGENKSVPPKINVAPLMRKLANDDIYSLKDKKVKTEIKMEKILKEANDCVDDLKRVGYSKSDILTSLSKKASALIDYLYDNNNAKSHIGIKTNLYPMDSKISKLASLEGNFNHLTGEFISIVNELDELNQKRQSLNNVAGVMIDG